MDTTPPVDPDPRRNNIPPHQLEADDEVDVDLGDEDQLRHPTIQEGVECLGEFESVEAYLRAMIEPEISRSIAPWLVDCIDWDAVLVEFERNGDRYMCEAGLVYRLSLSLKPSPKPTPGEDPPGPWMPTRGE